MPRAGPERGQLGADAGSLDVGLPIGVRGGYGLLRSPEAADRWTWLLIVAHTQLRLTRPLAADLRRPWEKHTTSGRLTPAQVRREFRNIRAHLACPAHVPKPRGAGPGRPPGAKNEHRTSHYDVGKTLKRPETRNAIGKPRRSW